MFIEPKHTISERRNLIFASGDLIWPLGPQMSEDVKTVFLGDTKYIKN